MYLLVFMSTKSLASLTLNIVSTSPLQSMQLQSVEDNISVLRENALQDDLGSMPD